MEHMSKECFCEGKVCKDCQELKCHGDFYTYITRSKDRNRVLEPRCKLCSKARRKAWQNSTPEKAEKYRQIRNKNARRWQKENPEKAQEYKKKWNQKNQEYHKEYDRRWRKENPEKTKVYEQRKKIFWEMNPLKRLEMRKKYYEKYKERYKGKYKAYYKTYQISGWARWHKRHPEIKKAHYANRRAQELAMKGSFTPLEWKELVEKYDHRCLWCGKQEPEIELTVDHIVPVSLNGTNYIDNIQPLCRQCNSRKNTKIIDFRAQNT